jgi:hypothetical protein
MLPRFVHFENEFFIHPFNDNVDIYKLWQMHFWYCNKTVWLHDGNILHMWAYSLQILNNSRKVKKPTESLQLLITCNIGCNCTCVWRLSFSENLFHYTNQSNTQGSDLSSATCHHHPIPLRRTKLKRPLSTHLLTPMTFRTQMVCKPIASDAVKSDYTPQNIGYDL